MLETLNEVKTSSTQIDRSLHESAEIKRKLMSEYEQYKDICNRAAKLYVGINQIYAMSVNVFMSLYVKTISLEKVCEMAIFHSKWYNQSLSDFSFNLFTCDLISLHNKDFDQHKIFGQVVKSTYNMLSRALPKDEHFALALHILKEAHPELVSERVNQF